MITKHTLSQLAAGSLLLLCFTGFAFAQTATGTVRGGVTDRFGGLVPQAQVTVSDGDGVAQKIESGDDGKFTITHLAPGHYAVSVSAKGLVPAYESDLVVDSGKVTVDDFVLEISDVAVEQVNANE